MAQQKKKPIGENGLRVVSLFAENVKKIVAVEIHPSGRMVEITGANKAGKSSVIDCIWLAIDRSSNPQEQIVRTGQTQARIRLDLGEIIVERRFNDKGGNSLTVESVDGAQFKSPQTLLDQFFRRLSFDPHAFLRMDDKKQYAELRDIAELDVDIDVLEGQIDKAFAHRTTVNRDAKARRSQAEAIVVPKNLPPDPVDEKTLLDQIQEAGEHNAQIEARKSNRDRAHRDIADYRSSGQRLDDEAAKLRRQAEELDKKAAEEREKASALEAKLAEAPALPDPVDVTSIRIKLDEAQAVNKQIARRESRTVIEADAKTLEDEAAELTASIDAKREAIATAIAGAKMPVPGLGFANGVVTYNGLPFNQASAAEQLTVSFAIAKSANPTLRVVLIKDASLLDADSIAQIAELAADGDYQLWLEKVDTSGKIGFFIEDGALTAVDGKPVPPADAKPKAGGSAQASLV